jgi:hypothetical protein
MEAGTKEKLMTPRPLYQWKCFWLGIFMLIFLGWAWWNSYQRAQNATRLQNGNYYQIIHIHGELLFRHGTETGVISGIPAWKFGNSTTGISATKMKANWDRDGREYQSISDTWIVGFQLLCFGTFIVWRTRRWKRLSVDPIDTVRRADGP